MEIKYWVTQDSKMTQTFFGASLDGSAVHAIYPNEDIEGADIIPEIVGVLQEKVIKVYLIDQYPKLNMPQSYYQSACLIAKTLAREEIVEWSAMDNVQDIQEFMDNMLDA